MLDSTSTSTISPEDRKKIVSWRQQEKSLNRLWIQELKTVFTEIGICWVQSVDEGERCAYMLQADGRVDAVYSTDTDLLAYGCPITINSFKVDTRASKRIMPYYNLNYILSTLGFTQEEFLEFCILCGTDFNKNIEKIGPVKAYELIKAHKAIKNLPSVYKKIPLNVDVLNETECKRIFTRVPSQDLIESTNNHALDIDKSKWENCSSFLVSYFGKSSANWLLQDMKRVTI
jgi:5'-3' exonuclease